MISEFPAPGGADGEGAPPRSVDFAVLLVEDNDGDADLVREALAEDRSRVRLSRVGKLSEALALLRREPIDCALLDLSLPDATGLQALRALNEAFGTLAVVVLTGTAEQATGADAMLEGAQDYLVKGEVDGARLSRAIRYAVERQRHTLRLRALAVERAEREAEAKALRDELGQVRELLDALPGFAIAARGPVHTVEHVNRADAEIWGEHEPVGKPVRDAYPDLATPELASLWDRCYLNGEAGRAPNVAVRVTRSGRERTVYFDVTLLPRRGEAGRVRGVLAFGFEITGQIRMRQLAEQANAHTRLAIDVMQAALETTDLAACERAIVARLRDGFGADAATLLTVSEPEGALVVEASIGLADAHLGARVPLGSGLAGSIALRGTSKIVDDVRAIDVVSPHLLELASLMAVPIKLASQVIGVLHVGTFQPRVFTADELRLLEAIATRIAFAIRATRLHEAARTGEARWRAVLDHMSDMVAIADTDATTVYANPSCRRWAFVDSDAPDPAAADRLEFLHPDGTSFARDELPLLRAARGEEVREVELVVRDTAGRERIGSWSASPLRDDRGNVVAAVALGRDVTTQRRNEAELRRLIAERDELLRVVSRDLRGSLTAILARLESARRRLGREGPARDDESLEAARAVAWRMSTMINELVQAAELDAGKLAIEPRPCALGPLVAGLLARYEGAARVELEIAPELPEVLVDPAATERVLTNLVSNALKYSDARTKVRLVARVQLNELVVSVVDHGAGMSEAEQARLFERIFQTDAARESRESRESRETRGTRGTRGNDGLGLGLYTARKLVEAQGGRIWAESHVGTGSTFSFTVPLARPERTSNAA